MNKDDRWTPIGDFHANFDAQEAGRFFGLSPRETQAVSLFALGATSRQVQRAMDITDNTLNTFKRRILAKMGVKTVMAATALFAVRATKGQLRRG